MDDMTEKDGRNIVPLLLMRKDVCACLALQYGVFLMHAFAQLKILQLGMSMYTYACYLPSFFGFGGDLMDAPCTLHFTCLCIFFRHMQ